MVMATNKKHTTTDNMDENNVSLNRRLRRMKRRLLFEYVERDDMLNEDDEKNTENSDHRPIDGAASMPLKSEQSSSMTTKSRQEKLRHTLPIHRMDKHLRDSSNFHMTRLRD